MSPTLLPLVFEAPRRGKPPKHWFDLSREERVEAATNLGLPSAAIRVFQGMLLFFLLAVDLLSNYRVRLAGFGREAR